MECSNEYRAVVRYAPKRLPSMRWEQTGLVKVHLFEDEDEDEALGAAPTKILA